MTFGKGVGFFWFSVLTILLLGGCASHPPTKDVVANKRGYLDENFTIKKLSESQGKWARQHLSKDDSLGFKEMALNIDRQSTSPNASLTTLKATQTFVNAGRGMAKVLWEASSNGIPFSMEYMLSYRGLVTFRSQSVKLNQKNANSIYELKEISQFPDGLVDPKENEEYLFAYTLGSEIQMANHTKIEFKCKSAKFYPANSIHSGFEGKALDLNCEMSTEGILKGKSRYAYLQQYGISLMLESNEPTMQLNDKVTSVEIH